MDLTYFVIVLFLLYLPIIQAKYKTQQQFLSAENQNIHDSEIDIHEEKLGSQILNIASIIIDFHESLTNKKQQTWIHRSRILQTNSASHRRLNNLKLNLQQSNSNLSLSENQQISLIGSQSQIDLPKKYQPENNEVSNSKSRILQANSRMASTRSATAVNTKSTTTKSSNQTSRTTKPEVLSSSRTYGSDENNDRFDSKTHEDRGGKTRSNFFSGTIRPRN